MSDSMPTYDPIVNNQQNFDPITLLPVFGSASPPNVPGLMTPNGAPINFFIPPPEAAGFNLPPAPAPAPSWHDYLPYIVGGVTIALLIGIYFLIRRASK